MIPRYIPGLRCAQISCTMAIGPDTDVTAAASVGVGMGVVVVVAGILVFVVRFGVVARH